MRQCGSTAVRDMLPSLDDGTVALLHKQLGVETNSRVKKEIATGLGAGCARRFRYQGASRRDRHAAPKRQPGCAEQSSALLDKNPDGGFIETDESVRRAAAAAVASIDQWRSFYADIETLFFGLSLGSVLVLIAIGLAITFGVMGVINMAHGELMMLGAYTTYAVQTAMPGHIGISILVAIPAAFIVAGLVGVAMERTIIRFLYGRPLETLLATFGVSLMLQQTVRSIFSALNRSVVTPDWMSGSLQLNDALAITYNRLYIVIFTLIVFFILISGLEAHANRSRHPGRFTESVHGKGHGDPHRVGRCHDIRAWIGHRRGGGRSAEPVDQRWSESGAILHHRFVHGGCFRRRGESVGRAYRRHVDGDRQQTAGTLCRSGAGQRFSSLSRLILFIQGRPRGLFPPAGRGAEDK